jgi:hypothetical protein
MCAVLLPKINFTAHLRKRRKTYILRRINIGSEAFKLLLSVFFLSAQSNDLPAVSSSPLSVKPFFRQADLFIRFLQHRERLGSGGNRAALNLRLSGRRLPLLYQASGLPHSGQNLGIA